MEQLNHQLFLLINATPASPEWLLLVANFFAVYVINIIPLILLISWLWVPHRELVLKAVSALVIATVVAKLISAAYPHARPFVDGVGYQFLYHSASSSFPSNHGTTAFTFALAFILWGRMTQGIVFFSMALAIAWARVYLGVHWPMDMAGGFLVGLLGCAITQFLWLTAGKIMLVKSEFIYRRLFVIPIKRNWVKY